MGGSRMERRHDCLPSYGGVEVWQLCDSIVTLGNVSYHRMKKIYVIAS